jgi:hypothetical protein
LSTGLKRREEIEQQNSSHVALHLLLLLILGFCDLQSCEVTKNYKHGARRGKAEGEKAPLQVVRISQYCVHVRGNKYDVRAPVQ